MDEKHNVDNVEHVPRNNSTASQRQYNVARKGSLSASIDQAFSTDRRGSVRDLEYVDHRENDDRADEAKGRDSAAFDGKYWYSANFIGTLLAIGFSFMAGIGGKQPSLTVFRSVRSIY